MLDSKIVKFGPIGNAYTFAPYGFIYFETLTLTDEPKYTHPPDKDLWITLF